MGERIRDRVTPAGRWEVFKCECPMCADDRYQWNVAESGTFTESFPTHAEAIAYADKQARTTKNGDAS